MRAEGWVGHWIPLSIFNSMAHISLNVKGSTSLPTKIMQSVCIMFECMIRCNTVRVCKLWRNKSTKKKSNNRKSVGKMNGSLISEWKWSEPSLLLMMVVNTKINTRVLNNTFWILVAFEKWFKVWVRHRILRDKYHLFLTIELLMFNVVSSTNYSYSSAVDGIFKIDYQQSF